jgi:hypothetical protein
MIKVDQPVPAICQGTKPQVEHANGLFSIGCVGLVAADAAGKPGAKAQYLGNGHLKDYTFAGFTRVLFFQSVLPFFEQDRLCLA